MRDKDNYAAIVAGLQEKIRDFVLRGIPEGELEIVLGDYTDSVLCRELFKAGQLFKTDGGAVRLPDGIKDKQTMHGGRLWDKPVVVDSGTPHLWSVRRKRKTP